MKKILGIVEGYYGKPWTFDQRKRVIAAIARWGYNTYVYAPKDDPFHRDRWREPYPAEIEARICELAGFSEMHEINFFYTLSPGRDFSYSSEEDREILMAKLAHFFSRGIIHLGILFDDIAGLLTNAKDKKRFPSLAAAQNHVLRKIYAEVKKWNRRISLLTCPTLYHGRGDEPSTREFCARLPRDLLVFWTGREVCSQALSAPDARFFTARTGHRPLYWDNYPVNDSVIKWEMHLGPYKHRDHELFECSDGIVLNVMEYPEASLIPLKTAGDCYRLGGEYDPASSWESALRELVPASFRDAFRRFALFNFKSSPYPYFSNHVLLWDLIDRINQPGWDFQTWVQKFLKEHEAAFRQLKKQKRHPLIAELFPWIIKFGLTLCYLKYYARCRHTNALVRIINRLPRRFYQKKYLLDRHEVFQMDFLDFLPD